MTSGVRLRSGRIKPSLRYWEADHGRWTSANGQISPQGHLIHKSTPRERVRASERGTSSPRTEATWDTVSSRV